MLTALSLLFASRKFWVATITVLSIVAGTVLVSLGKIDSTQLLVTVGGIAATGITLIGSISWEDSASKRGNAQTTIATSATATPATKDDE